MDEALSGVPAATSPARAWCMASRPATLTAAIAPVAVGSACAAAVGGFQLLPAIAALVGAMLIQIGTNFANDLFDYEKGADTHARLGPTRVVQAGLLSSSQVRTGMLLTFGLALLVGIYLMTVGGWPIAAIGVASIAAGIAYTGGPWPLGYHGLGDVFVFVFFGIVAVCGTAFVQVGAVPALAWGASLPLGALCTNILLVNNLRDRHTDRLAGKRTLAVRLGRRGARLEYLALQLLAYLAPILLLAGGWMNPWGLLPLLSLPLALRTGLELSRTEGAALNPLLGASARLLLLYALLFSVGLVLGARQEL